MNKTKKALVEHVILIGYGEVGRAFGKQIEQVNIALTYVDPVFAGSHNGRTILESLPAVLPNNSLVLGAVPSAVSLQIAKDIMARSGENILYIDLSSSPQKLMRDCASLFESTEIDFVDGAIMGSVDLTGAASPLILSGAKAEYGAKILKQLGFNVSALTNSNAGDACALKLLRTLMTKGIEALAIECYATANRMNLSDALRQNLNDISNRPFADLLDAMVRTHVIHSPRRQYEVEAAIEQVKEQGLQSPVTEAVLKVYQNNAQRVQSEKPTAPANVAQALDWLTGVN